MKKISKKSLLLVGGCAVLAVSCVLAYFFSSMQVTNLFSVGEANVYLNETFDVDDKWVPGEEKEKTVNFGNDGDMDVVIRAKFTPILKLENGETVTDKAVLNGFQLNYIDTFPNEWEKGDDGWYYYKKVLAPEEKTGETLTSVTMSNRISNDVHGIQTDYSNSQMDVDVVCEAILATVSKDNADLQGWSYYPVVSGTNVSWTKK